MMMEFIAILKTRTNEPLIYRYYIKKDGRPDDSVFWNEALSLIDSDIKNNKHVALELEQIYGYHYF